jgi:hypothetical protein
MIPNNAEPFAVNSGVTPLAGVTAVELLPAKAGYVHVVTDVVLVNSEDDATDGAIVNLLSDSDNIFATWAEETGGGVGREFRVGPRTSVGAALKIKSSNATASIHYFVAGYSYKQVS